VLIIVVLALVVVGGAVVWVLRSIGQTEPTRPPQSTVSASSSQPPSDGGAGDAPSPSPTLVPTPDVTTSVQSEPIPEGTAVATIVTWGADDAGVHASGIVTGETGTSGVCTLTATSSAGESVTGQVVAHDTPAAVNCGVIQVPVPAGIWTLTLSFRSDIAVASSEPVEVVRP
jgi:hypothetical protein